MQTIHVARDIDTDAATLFDVISDHAGYARLPGVRRAYLRRPGEAARDGVGAERVLCLPGFTLVERITAFVPGVSMAYCIVESPLPIDHLGARMLLQPLAAGGTRLNWTSRLRARTPIARDLASSVFALQLRAAYVAALAVWARRLG